MTTLIAGLACAMLGGPALAENEESLSQRLATDLREGKVTLPDSEHAAVIELIINRDIPIPSSYIETLMHMPNAFGPGPACVVCHASSDPAESYRGLDLSTCEGIRAGSTEEPARALFVPGEDPKREIIGRRLRNNRMPLGVPFSVSGDNPNVRIVEEWIAAGAPNDEHFQNEVLGLFSMENAFAPDTPACTDCHMSNQEPPSFHELNLSTWEGIMLGADSVAKGVDNATKVILPGDAAGSILFQHLVEDRMPPGIDPTEDRDHPNTQILFSWIMQGAQCD